MRIEHVMRERERDMAAKAANTNGLRKSEATDAVQTMRRRGVRRENAWLNTSRRLYAFNWLQQLALPEQYKPPEGTARGGHG